MESQQSGEGSVPELPPNLRRDINAGSRAWVDGLRRGDASQVVESYAQDSIYCNWKGDCVKGPVALAARYKEILDKFGKADDATVRSETLHVDHDLAYESGYSEARFSGGALVAGRFSTVWRLQPDGHWRIFRNMSLSAPGS
jgi:ketosteroid isomerase-like protein